MEMSANDERLIARFERAMDVLGAKWKPAILYCLTFAGPLRFSALRRLIPAVSQKMLTQRLRELERDGIVKRTFYEQVPPKVEYELTDLGKSAGPLLASFCHWAEEAAKPVDKANRRFDRAKP